MGGRVRLDWIRIPHISTSTEPSPNQTMAPGWVDGPIYHFTPITQGIDVNKCYVPQKTIFPKLLKCSLVSYLPSCGPAWVLLDVTPACWGVRVQDEAPQAGTERSLDGSKGRSQVLLLGFSSAEMMGNCHPRPTALFSLKSCIANL